MYVSQDTHTAIFDLSNVSYVGAYFCGRGVENNPDAPELIKQSTLNLMRMIYRQIAATTAFFACDHSQYWRKKMFPDYKAQRRHTLLKQQVREAIKLIKDEKQELCLEVEHCEADDVIYTASQLVEDKITIVSSDSDFVQLESETVRRFHPHKREYYPQPKNPAYDLFVKCIRGDSADNIPSAYPFVQEKRLKSAFRNEGFYKQLMQSVNKHGKRVEECYEFNRKLIDLTCIPQEIQLRLKQHLTERLAR